MEEYARASWTVEGTGKKLSLITPKELKSLPDNTLLYDIFGEAHILGGLDTNGRKVVIDDDTRGGFLAYGLPLEDTSKGEA